MAHNDLIKLRNAEVMQGKELKQERSEVSMRSFSTPTSEPKGGVQGKSSITFLRRRSFTSAAPPVGRGSSSSRRTELTGVPTRRFVCALSRSLWSTVPKSRAGLRVFY